MPWHEEPEPSRPPGEERPESESPDVVERRDAAGRAGFDMPEPDGPLPIPVPSASPVGRAERLGRPDVPQPSATPADAERRMLAQVTGRHMLSNSIVARLRSASETATQARL